MEKMIHCTYTDDTLVTIQTSEVNDVLHTAHDASGRYVTPADMLVAALGACTLTMIGAVAQKYKQSMDNLQIQLKPVFAADLSGLTSVEIQISFPPDTPEELRKRLLEAAQKCPVHRSLNPAISYTITSN